MPRPAGLRSKDPAPRASTLGPTSERERAAFLPWTEEDVATVALAVIEEALERAGDR